MPKKHRQTKKEGKAASELVQNIERSLGRQLDKRKFLLLLVNDPIAESVARRMKRRGWKNARIDPRKPRFSRLLILEK